MEPSVQLVKYMKLEPIERRSECNILIEDWAQVKPHVAITSSIIDFLDSKTVWWISIQKQASSISLTTYIDTSDCTETSGMWNFYATGTINGMQFETDIKRIIHEEGSHCKRLSFDSQNETLDLKLVMCMSQDCLDEVPLQKFIGTSCQYKNIIANNESILRTAKYSDFSFDVNGRMFKVHKSILATASPVFDKLFQRKCKEGVPNHSRIDDTDPTIFQYLLDYIYCGKLPEEIHDGQVARNVFKVANYYQINRLEEVCVSVLKYSLTKDNAVDAFELAETYGLEDVKMMAWSIIQFEILELSDAELPKKTGTIHSLIAIKEEKTMLLQEYEQQIRILDASTKNLLMK
ncbi:Speckle-type POZ protein-like [Pseudolycoriella hygida]|uniref:Speckle-type POZ protein-like n=1 Tax=Pseudolycoriella hygida TaxID=35572 RepID=A0A9Q0RS76_9DIPT|nr:Speckle-type POZ protein-like [Pseudolycoriella hygida]